MYGETATNSQRWGRNGAAASRIPPPLHGGAWGGGKHECIQPTDEFARLISSSTGGAWDGNGNEGIRRANEFAIAPPRLFINGWGRTPHSHEFSHRRQDVPDTVSKMKVSALPTNSQASSRVIINDWGRTLPTSTRQSRSRRLPAVLETSGAGAHRSGIALPSFLPRGIPPTQSREIACAIDPFGHALNLKLAALGWRNYRRVADQPEITKSNRRKVIRDPAQIADSPRPLKNELKKASRPLCPRIDYVSR